MKTSEMIAMLEENPKLKFKGTEWADGSVLQLDKWGRITIINPGLNISNDIILSYIPSAIDWRLIREPVPVWEAIKAVTEGKTVKCETDTGYHKFNNKYSDNLNLAKEILNGTWYIEP